VCVCVCVCVCVRAHVCVCVRARARSKKELFNIFNPLNTELNPICHLLALLGAHYILQISRIRVHIILVLK